MGTLSTTPRKRLPLFISITALLALALGLFVVANPIPTAHAAKRTAVVQQHTAVQQVAQVQNLTAAAQGNNCHGSVSDGPGIIAPGHDNVGLMKFCGKAWVCISPLLGLSQSQSWKEIAKLTGTNTETSLRIWYLLYEYIPKALHLDATGHHKAAGYTAASLRIAVNKLVGKTANKAALKRWKQAVPTSVYANGTDAAHNHLQYLAKRLHGPYKLSVKLSGSLQPGRTRTLTAHLTAASGAAVSGKTASYKASGASLSRSRVNTNSAGNASVSLTAYKVGWVSYSVSVSGLASTHGLLSIPGSRYQQQLLSQAPGVRKVASGKAASSFPRVKLTAVCPSDCDPNTVPVNGSAIPNPTRYTWYATLTAQRVVNGKTVTVNLGKRAIKGGTTVSPKWTAHNGDKKLQVTLSTTVPETVIVNGKKKVIKHTASQVVGVLGVVDCQPFTPVKVAQTLFCGKCKSVTLESDVNSAATTVTFTYSDSAGNHATYQVAPGKSLAPVTYNINASQVTYTVTESVPYATHSGARTQTAHGTLTLSMS